MSRKNHRDDGYRRDSRGRRGREQKWNDAPSEDWSDFEFTPAEPDIQVREHAEASNELRHPRRPKRPKKPKGDSPNWDPSNPKGRIWVVFTPAFEGGALRMFCAVAFTNEFDRKDAFVRVVAPEEWVAPEEYTRVYGDMTGLCRTHFKQAFQELFTWVEGMCEEAHANAVYIHWNDGYKTTLKALALRHQMEVGDLFDNGARRRYVQASVARWMGIPAESERKVTLKDCLTAHGVTENYEQGIEKKASLLAAIMRRQVAANKAGNQSS